MGKKRTDGVLVNNKFPLRDRRIFEYIIWTWRSFPIKWTERAREKDTNLSTKIQNKSEKPKSEEFG
jgi:hypothetical protein